MTDSVKIEFGFGQLAAVQIGYQDCFVFEVRSGKEFAERIDNATAAAREHGVRFVPKGRGVMLRKVAATVELVAAQNEASAFRGDVLHASRPCIAMVGGG